MEGADTKGEITTIWLHQKLTLKIHNDTRKIQMKSIKLRLKRHGIHIFECRNYLIFDKIDSFCRNKPSRVKIGNQDITDSPYMNRPSVIFQLNFKLEYFSDITDQKKKYFKSIRITFRTPSEITISFFRFSFQLLRLKYGRLDFFTVRTLQ